MQFKTSLLLLPLFLFSLNSQAVETLKSPTKPYANTIKKQIDLNKAQLAELTGSFKGIGKKRAQAIIAYRDQHKGFKSIEEFADVRGLGQRFVDMNREALKAVFIIR